MVMARQNNFTLMFLGSQGTEAWVLFNGSIYCWCFRNPDPANLLIWRFHPIIYRFFFYIQPVVVWDFWTINSMYEVWTAFHCRVGWDFSMHCCCILFGCHLKEMLLYKLPRWHFSHIFLRISNLKFHVKFHVKFSCCRVSSSVSCLEWDISISFPTVGIPCRFTHLGGDFFRAETLICLKKVTSWKQIAGFFFEKKSIQSDLMRLRCTFFLCMCAFF